MDMDDLNGEASLISVSVQLTPAFQPSAAASSAELLIDHCRENEGWRVCILKLPGAMMATGSMKLK